MQSIPKHGIVVISDLLCIPSSALITPDSSTSAVWLDQRHLVVKQEMSLKLADMVSLSYYARFFNMQ
jgi:hypothetical protein